MRRSSSRSRSTAPARSPSTSPSAASGRCGTFLRDCFGASSRRTSSPRPSDGVSCRSRCTATALMAKAPCRSSCTRTSRTTTSRSARIRRTAIASRGSVPSTSSRTTPTARAATAWEFAGEPLPDGVRDDLRRLVTDGPPAALSELLDARECQAVVTRARRLAKAGRFPSEGSADRYPWPPV